MPIHPTLVLATVKKMSKHAATAIDGWNRNLLMTALTAEPDLAESLGIVLSMIASSHTTQDNTDGVIPFVWFNKTVMDIIRAARLVGIPKPEGGLRPIVIGSFFAKLVGAALLRRSGVRQIPDQYAIGTVNGAKTIGHIAREEYQARNKAIIRLDIKNAYNSTVRKEILAQLKDTEEKIDSDLICYFNTMYQPSSTLFIFGKKQEYETIETDEGIRQGDAPSSYYFCLVMRKVRDKLVEQFPNESDFKNMGYMDDTTICVKPELAERVVLAAINAFEECGFEINKEKSAVICKKEIPRSADSAEFPIPIADKNEQFKMLGINITNNYEEYNKVLEKRIVRFFEILNNINVNPAIKHLILHLCGKPKLLYYCETTPPEYTNTNVRLFDELAKRTFASIIGIDDHKLLKDEILHDKLGGNIPCYSKHNKELYDTSLANAFTGGRMQSNLHGVLTTLNKDNFKSPECSHDRQWTYFTHPSPIFQLNPFEYQVALAIRCGLAPDLVLAKMGDTVRCDCNNNIIDVRTELAKHLCSCNKMCNLTFTHRHTFVKTAVSAVLSIYGKQSDNEPLYYHYPGGNFKPDLTVRMYNTKNITTDFTIVKPDEGGEIGAAAARAAEEKVKRHHDAVAAFNHIFIPFAMESTGHMDKSCIEFYKMVRQEVAFHKRPQFKRDFFGAISVALARFRALSMISTSNIGNIN